MDCASHPLNNKTTVTKGTLIMRTTSAKQQDLLQIHFPYLRNNLRTESYTSSCLIQGREFV